MASRRFITRLQDDGAPSLGGNVTLPVVDGTNGQVITTDGAGAATWQTPTSYLANIVEDTTPQFGGNVDNNGFGIGDGTNEILVFAEVGSAVNHVSVSNNATGSAPIVAAVGDDTNINLQLNAKGTGGVNISGAFTLPNTDGTNGQYLETDGSGGLTWTSLPASSLELPTQTKTANYTVLTSEGSNFFLLDSTSGDVTITLPASASAGNGFFVGFKRTDGSANTVTIDGDGSETIDGAVTYTLDNQHDALFIVADGSNWRIWTEPATATTDVNAIHDNTAGEISPLTSVALATGDHFLIEDASDSNNKKRVLASAIDTYIAALKSADIGTTVQGFDADTAKYDDATANFTGTLQNGGSPVVVDSDIGVNVQAYDADTAKTDVVQAYTASQSAAPVTLTSSTNSVAVDLSLRNNFELDMTENTTLAAPTNAVEGQSGVITITQDDTTAFTLAYNTFWEFEGGSAPALSTTLSSRSTFVYYVDAGGATATCNLIGPVS